MSVWYKVSTGIGVFAKRETKPAWADQEGR